MDDTHCRSLWEQGGGRGVERTEARTARNERAYDIHHRDAWYALCVLQSEVCERCIKGE
jgi:hypothetical protein